MSKKWVDKKKDKTYRVVHRANDDPLYYDDEAGDQVLMELENPNSKKNRKVKTKTQLEQELGDELQTMRPNEGEAALYGITFDDSKYDYMQHLMPMGGTGGIFIPKKGSGDQDDGKKKGIEFKEVDLPDGVLPSKTTVQRTYQDQQNVPDEISGFQPDMNPALREVLEALEDEAYVEEDDEVFQDLLAAGEQVNESDFEERFDEWDLDNYEDEMAKYDAESFVKEGDEGWEADFRKYKALTKHKKNDWDSDDEFGEEEEDTVPDLPTFQNNKNSSTTKGGSKRKQRYKKGAMTDTSSFSMTSSALFRNEGLTLIDDKFEKVLKDYEKEDDEEEENEKPFNMANQREDFEGMLDDFLDNYEIEGGRRLVKKNEELDRFKQAADSASKGKLAQKRKKQREMSGVQNALGDLKL